MLACVGREMRLALIRRFVGTTEAPPQLFNERCLQRLHALGSLHFSVLQPRKELTEGRWIVSGGAHHLEPALIGFLLLLAIPARSDEVAPHDASRLRVAAP